MKLQIIGLVSVAALALAACGEKEATVATPEPEAAAPAEVALLSNGLSAAATIEARQKSLKEMGGAFKSIGDQLKSGEPSLEQIQPAAALIEAHSKEIGNWFPEGSGPATGLKTAALDTIWSDPAGFATAVSNFQTAAAGINAAAVSGDLAAVGGATRPLGMSCKGCHDTYKAKDD